MIKKILEKIKKLEKQKETKVARQMEIQKGIDDIDINLKKLYSLKKDYEKLQNNASEYLDQI